jgi:hypothetical protein
MECFDGQYVCLGRDGRLPAMARSQVLNLGSEQEERYIYIACRSSLHISDLNPMLVYLWMGGLALTANVSGCSGMSSSAKLGNRLG